MPLYEITTDAFRSITESSLAEMKLRERGDLQRLLRAQIEVLADDLYVIAEEFGDWEDMHLDGVVTKYAPTQPVFLSPYPALRLH